MLLWLLLLQVLCVRGMPPPTTLTTLTTQTTQTTEPPVEDGCLVVTPEVELFRVEGEAVVLSFPFLRSDLRARRMSESGASVLISKTNRTDAPNATRSPAPEAEGRVLQRGAQLWLLPAQESDSGHYTCTYRTEALCVRGALTLQVYAPRAVDMDRLSYNIPVTEGEHLSFRCPLGAFNRTETHVHWDKVSGPEEPFESSGGRLLIPGARRGHRGLYRCEAQVQLNQRWFRVSRAVLITVHENPLLLHSDPSVTPDPALTSTQTAAGAAPIIVAPLNGSVFENSYGSGVELLCAALTDCPAAASTLVTWLVDGQSVEASYLEGRALQGSRRVGWAPEGCQVEVRLMILELRERDTEAELKCVTENQHGRQEVSVRLQLEDSTHTWLVVSSVALLCLVSVVSVFLCVLLRPKSGRTKADYTLARQNSSFSSEL